jgi:hypothetical protein
MSDRQSTLSSSHTEPYSTSYLTLNRERSKRTVNGFLETHHPRGGVPGWKACWTAQYASEIVALIVLGRPVSRHADDGTQISITRFARRDDRPANTGSWLIGQVRPWARLEGYDRLVTHAGVAGNYGTTYEAAGFRCTDVTQADGSGWTSRDSRDEWDDYTRRTWVYDL